MVNTKLIFVSGISGSGKSTTAHYISRQMKKNGIKVKWFHEHEFGHPLKIIVQKENESYPDFHKRRIDAYPKIWKDMVDKFKKGNCVYIIEGYLFQNIIDIMLEYHMPKKEIITHIQNIHSIAECLNPHVIYLHQKDVDKHTKTILKLRISDDDNFTYRTICACEEYYNNKYKGEESVVKYNQEMSEIAYELFKQLNFRKLLIETSQQNWDLYHNQILNFLDIPKTKDITLTSYEEYCGYYAGYYPGCLVHVKNNKLYMHLCSKYDELIPLKKDIFEVNSLPVKYKFIRNESGNIESLQILNDLIFGGKMGDVHKRKDIIRLKRDQLESYCGEYWCEANKLIRKIYLKDGVLYFWRKEYNESELIPSTETQFMMRIWVDNTLEFEFVNGDWQFTFDIKGDNPQFYLFVRKK